MKRIPCLILMSGVFLSLNASEYTRDTLKEIVIDSKSSLMWQDNLYSSKLDINYTQALNYCKTLEFADHKDWRLPSLNELKTIVDKSKYPLAIVQGFEHTQSEYYWSSSSYGSEFAWLILFRYGNEEYYYKRDTNHVRCVRSVK